MAKIHMNKDELKNKFQIGNPLFFGCTFRLLNGILNTCAPALLKLHFTVTTVENKPCLMAVSRALQITHGKSQKYCLMKSVHFIRNIPIGVHHSGNSLLVQKDIVW